MQNRLLAMTMSVVQGVSQRMLRFRKASISVIDRSKPVKFLHNVGYMMRFDVLKIEGYGFMFYGDIQVLMKVEKCHF